jgi:hypothetical protein
MEYAINNRNVPRWELCPRFLPLLALVTLPLALFSPTRGAAERVEISTFLHGLRLYSQGRAPWLEFTFDCFIFTCFPVWGPWCLGAGFIDRAYDMHDVNT